MADEYNPPYDDVEAPDGNSDPPIYDNCERPAEGECYETDVVQPPTVPPRIFPRQPSLSGIQRAQAETVLRGAGQGATPRTETTTGRLRRTQHHGAMTQRQKSLLTRNWQLIIDNVRAEDIVDHLIEKQVIDIEARQEIMAHPVTKERTALLINRLVTRGNHAYHHFMDALKQKCSFIYEDLARAESSTKVDEQPVMFERPMDGEALRRQIHRSLSVISPGRRKTKQLELQKMEEYGHINVTEDAESPKAIMVQAWQKDDVSLEKGDEVFIAEVSDDLVTIITRFGIFKIPKNYVKVHGDPTIERYFIKMELTSTQAKTFIDQAVRKSERNGVYVVYKPKGRCLMECEFHLCVGFFKGVTSNYHIVKKDGYILSKMMERTGNPYEEPVRNDIRFNTVTELVNLYKVTSDKVLDGYLQWPMCDAESPLKPQDDFHEPIKILRVTDYTATSDVPIGKGYYSDVLKGTLRYASGTPIAVAIKTPNKLNQTKVKKEELYREAKILGMFNDENIVKIIGVCFTENVFHLLTELAPKGDLATVLSKKKDQIKKKRSSTSHRKPVELQYAQQIASGMRHLEDLHIVHRNLAARNILLYDNDVVKISGFGQARRLSGPEGNYYVTKADNIYRRWTAPEVLATLRHWLKSDVWSYGILLWELYSCGKIPYQNTATDAVWGFVVVADGRLEKPSSCPDDMYKLMLSCWSKEFKDRPSFTKIYDSLMFESYFGIGDVSSQPIMTEEEYSRMLNTAMSLEDYQGMYVNDNAQQTSMSTSPSYSYLRSTSANPQSQGDVFYDDIRIMDRHQV